MVKQLSHWEEANLIIRTGLGITQMSLFSHLIFSPMQCVELCPPQKPVSVHVALRIFWRTLLWRTNDLNIFFLKKHANVGEYQMFMTARIWLYPCKNDKSQQPETANRVYVTPQGFDWVQLHRRPAQTKSQFGKSLSAQLRQDSLQTCHEGRVIAGLPAFKDTVTHVERDGVKLWAGILIAGRPGRWPTSLKWTDSH